MNMKAKALLMKAVKEYGLNYCLLTPDELERKWDACTAEGKIVIPNANDLRVRSTIVGLGQILEEDNDNHTYVSAIHVGKNDALLVTLREENDVYIAACAHEGLIPQHIAKKAIDLVYQRTNILPFMKET